LQIADALPRLTPHLVIPSFCHLFTQ